MLQDTLIFLSEVRPCCSMSFGGRLRPTPGVAEQIQQRSNSDVVFSCAIVSYRHEAVLNRTVHVDIATIIALRCRLLKGASTVFGEV